MNDRTRDRDPVTIEGQSTNYTYGAGVAPDDREQMLLDDLLAEVGELRAEVAELNARLKAQSDGDAEGPQ